MEKGGYFQSGQSNKGQGSGAGASKSNYTGASKSYHAGASKSNHAGASKPNYSKPQSHGNNSGVGGNASSSSNADPYAHESGEQTLRRICWDMATNTGASYPERQFLADHFYDKYMDGGYMWIL